MKKLICFSLLILSTVCTQNLHAQLWEVPGAKITACWWTFGFLGLDTISNNGDTLINNKQYSKITRTSANFWQSPAIEYYFTDVKKFYFRKQNDSLFHYDLTNNIDRLIIDFGKQVGEEYVCTGTYTDSPTYLGDYTVRVDSIKSYTFLGNTYRRFYLSEPHYPNNASSGSILPHWDLYSSYPLVLNEGNSQRYVGIYDELFGTIDFSKIGLSFFGSNYESQIFKDYQYYQGQDSLRNNTENCRDFILNNDKIENAESINCFPNPFENNIYFKIGKADNTELLIKIYNSLGEMVKTESIQSSGYIKVTELPAGVYFCEVSKSGVSLFRKKLIKSN